MSVAAWIAAGIFALMMGRACWIVIRDLIDMPRRQDALKANGLHLDERTGLWIDENGEPWG